MKLRQNKESVRTSIELIFSECGIALIILYIPRLTLFA